MSIISPFKSFIIMIIVIMSHIIIACHRTGSEGPGAGLAVLTATPMICVAVFPNTQIGRHSHCWSLSQITAGCRSWLGRATRFRHMVFFFYFLASY